MGIAERRAREKEELRSHILEAARELFATEGYEAVSMRRIAERIEYSPTAIYLHFRDKEALFQELCTRDFLTLAQRFQHLAEVADPVRRLREVGMAYAEFALAHPNHYRLMFMTPRPDVPAHPEMVEKGNPSQDAYAFLRETVEACIEQGRFRPEYADLDRTALLAWAAVHGVVSLHITLQHDTWVEWPPVRENVAAMLETMTRGFTAPDLGGGAVARQR